MGKSFKHDKNNYSESYNNKNEFKRKRNKIKEDRFNEDVSEYKIHGFKKNKKTD